MKNGLIVLAVILALGATSGCSSSSNSGGGGAVFTPVIDLAVGDNNADYTGTTGFEDASILLYFDVLNDTAGNLQDPDVVLDTTGSGVNQPRFLLLTPDGDLIVSDHDNADIEIWRDYHALSDGATPDVILSDDGGGVGTISSYPRQPLLGNDILIVPDESNSEVYLWGTESALVTNDTVPDVVLSTDISSPDGGYYDIDGDQLYIFNWTSTGTDECVNRYEDVQGIVTGGVDVAPDNFLTVDGSFLGIGDCRRGVVDELTDTLYVLTQSSDTGDEDALWVFAGASTFGDDDLPTAIIAHTGTQLLNPLNGAFLNNRLYVANRNNGDEDECKNFPGVVGFDQAADGSLVSGQAPSAQLGGTISGVAGAQEVRSVGGFLFVNNLPGCDDHAGFGDIRVFSGASGGPNTGDAPFLLLPSLKDFTAPISLDAILVQ